VVGGLLFVGVQLRSARKQMQANALQARVDTRINLWMKAVEEGAFPSAREKMREHDLHTAELDFQDLPHLSWKEKNAIGLHFLSELLYLQYLFYLRKKGLIEADQSAPLDQMGSLAFAASSRRWRTSYRFGDQAAVVEIRRLVSALLTMRKKCNENFGHWLRRPRAFSLFSLTFQHVRW